MYSECSIINYKLAHSPFFFWRVLHIPFLKFFPTRLWEKKQRTFLNNGYKTNSKLQLKDTTLRLGRVMILKGPTWIVAGQKNGRKFNLPGDSAAVTGFFHPPNTFGGWSPFQPTFEFGVTWTNHPTKGQVELAELPFFSRKHWSTWIHELTYGCFQKKCFPPNHPFVHRVFHEKFTIHFGGKPSTFWKHPYNYFAKAPVMMVLAKPGLSFW